MMKYALSLAVLALIGEVTAVELKSLQLEKPSDEVANGDGNEDRDLEDEDDPTDDIVDDNGFSHQWLQTKLEGDHARHMALAEQKVLGKKHRKHHHKHHNKHHHQMSQVQKAHKHHAKHHSKHHHKADAQVDYLLNQHNRYQSLAQSQNKFLGNPERVSVLDPIAYQTRANSNTVDGGIQVRRTSFYAQNEGRSQQEEISRDVMGLQIGSELRFVDDQFSEELVDGDRTDDIQVEKEDNYEQDGAVEENYLQLSSSISEEPHTSKGMQEEGSWWNQIRALAQQKKETDTMLLQLDDDINSNIGTLPGQTNAGYQSLLPKSYFEQNHILEGHHIQIPKGKSLGNNAYSQKPSDETANGDSADDREINDNGVDYNGHTNRGYGSALPKEYFERNHVLPGHHITVPREEAVGNLGNNVRAQMQDDINSNIGTLPGQTNTGYQSMLPKTYFEQNHIMNGHHITIPRDEAVKSLGNNVRSQV